MTARTRTRSALRSALRAAALCATAVALLATSQDHEAACPGPSGEDAAVFDAATSCGPAGAVTLREQERSGTGCGALEYRLLHAEDGAALGLPAIGEIDPDRVGTCGTALGDRLAASRMYLLGPVTIPGAIPAVTVERLCHLAPASPGVLSVACEGADPEAACTGTLTRQVTP